MFGLYKDPYQNDVASIFEPPTMADTYRGILREHSLNKINRVIENCTFEDSSSVYERFFSDCHVEIQIVARGIKSQIFDRPGVLKAVHRFFSRDGVNCKLHLPAKTQEDVDILQSSEFFRVATDAASGSTKMEINLYDASTEDFILDLPSVTFGDSRMYRKRLFSPVGDYSSTANADVNFNDSATVDELKTVTMAELKKHKLLGS